MRGTPRLAEWIESTDLPGKITSVRLTVNRSIQLLNSNGKKLISVETNMRGTPRLAEWIESTDLAALVTPAMERQTESQAAEESLVQWREEYRTHWHDHLRAIRMGLWVVMILLIIGAVLPIPLYLYAGVKFRTVMAIAAVTWHDHLRAIRMGLWVVMILLIIGAVLPIPLYLYAGVKFRTVMAIAAVTPIPFLIFCIVFTPVLIFGDRPKNATAEWNAMYIQLSLPAIFLPALFPFLFSALFLLRYLFLEIVLKMLRQNGTLCISSFLCQLSFYRLWQFSGRYIIYGAAGEWRQETTDGYGSFRRL